MTTRLADLAEHLKYHRSEVAELSAIIKAVKTLIIAHGDYDGVACASRIGLLKGINPRDVRVIFTQPFLVDKVEIPDEIEKVYVCDLAINNREPQMTTDFIERLGDRLASWYDHHTGWAHVDDRFIIDEDAPACAAILGDPTDRIIQDAIVADTREGIMSPIGQMVENAMKADLSNDTIRLASVKLMMGDGSQRRILEDAARQYAAVLDETVRLAGMYVVDGKPMSFFYSREPGIGRTPREDYKGNVASVDARKSTHQYDLTQLLLKGQELATFAIVKTVSPHTNEEIVTIATKTDVNLVELFEMKSGAPFRVSLPLDRFDEAIEKLKTHAEPIGQNFGQNFGLRGGC